MRFSLVMATIRRTVEVGNFIESLKKQRQSNLQLIVVDQNQDDRLHSILGKNHVDFEIKHLKSAAGLSRARNIGLEHADGECVAFPDDDCLYSPELLKDVATWLNNNGEYAGVSGRAVDENGSSTVSIFDNEAGEISKSNIWHRMTSIGLFLRWNAATRHLRFDVDLGLGSSRGFGAAEDIDFPLRIIARGLKLYYEPQLKVLHPPVTTIYDFSAARRAYFYGGGIGRVLHTHAYPWQSKVRALLRPLGGTALSVLTARPAKARFHWMAFKGRLRGMIK